jgi:glycosyltransferase involved in cell wall biosynthesis
VAQHEGSPYAADIHWFSGIEDEYIRHAYAGALLFLFPSLGEGFGWPIAEAMASGCPVVTTAEAPMTEVAGDAGFLISRRPPDENKAQAWAAEGAALVEKILAFGPGERKQVVDRGIKNAKRFDTEETLNQIEKIYQQIVSNGNSIDGK